jgi:integrase
MATAPQLAPLTGLMIDSAPATSSLPGTEVRIVPRRRFQTGRVYKRGVKWVGSYRDSQANPETGKRTRRTVTFPDSVTSERAARSALQPYLDRVNIAPPAPKKAGKTLFELIEQWKEQIIPNRKDGGARASLSHIRTYIAPQLGETPLRELNLSLHQAFVTAVGQRASRRKTVENVYGTFTSILNKGRKWGYQIPDVRREDVEFPVDKKPQDQIFFFDADTAAQVINVSVQPFKLMCLIAALCGLRIGEVTALKLASLDFKRKQIHVLAALDYKTRKETTPKSENSAAPVYMPELLAKHLREWLHKHYTPNADGYLFINRKGKPYLSDNVVRSGVHRAMHKLGIVTPKGVHLGIHCFRHGVTTELLEAGTPIHVVTRLMRHADSKVTLDHYAHIVGNAERLASERLSRKIGVQLESGPELESAEAKTA